MTPTPRQVGVKLRKLRQARKLSLVKVPGLHLKVPFIQDVHRPRLQQGPGRLPVLEDDGDVEQ
jgi:regulator of protease activity HflC (stomatin/prohibitin superfamily)